MTEIVRLAEWYPAMAAQWSGNPVPRSEREAWVHHHTAGGVGSNPLAYARQVADQHYAKWGVPGGYGFLIGTDAVAREMCGYDFEGVHSGTHYWNEHGIGLAFQGDFRNSPPTDAMLDTAREVMAEIPLDQTYHRAVRPTFTECPGDALIALLPLEIEMVDRNTKADDGNPALADNFDKMVDAGVFSEHTQPGGVTFNDEFATFLIRFENYIKAKYGLGSDGDGLTEAEVKAIINGSRIVAPD